MIFLPSAVSRVKGQKIYITKYGLRDAIPV